MFVSFFFIIIGATSNDIIAPPMCQVSEIESKRSDLISSAKVEVGSLAPVLTLRTPARIFSMLNVGSIQKKKKKKKKNYTNLPISHAGNGYKIFHLFKFKKD